jgi:hypothetical protein
VDRGTERSSFFTTSGPKTSSTNSSDIKQAELYFSCDHEPWHNSYITVFTKISRRGLSHLRKVEEFDKLLAESVSSTLGGVLGDKASDALMFHLGPLKHPLDPGELATRLERILGGGSVVIETLIVKNLSQASGIRVKEVDRFRFAKSIEIMRKELVAEQETSLR